MKIFPKQIRILHGAILCIFFAVTSIAYAISNAADAPPQNAVPNVSEAKGVADLIPSPANDTGFK